MKPRKRYNGRFPSINLDSPNKCEGLQRKQASWDLMTIRTKENILQYMHYFLSYSPNCLHILDSPQADSHLISYQYCTLSIWSVMRLFVILAQTSVYVDEQMGVEYSGGSRLLRKKSCVTVYPPNTLAFSLHLALKDKCKTGTCNFHLALHCTHTHTFIFMCIQPQA